MTKKEAIKYLEVWRECYRNSIDSCTAQAIGMAIEALKREDHDGCDGCRYEANDELSFPCAECKQNYVDKYVPMPEHDREWIIGCIKHDGFVKTDRGDKANQIILDALSADNTSTNTSTKSTNTPTNTSTKSTNISTDASADRPKGEWTPCEERLPGEKKAVLICDSRGNRFVGKFVLTDHGYKWSVPLFKISKVWVDIEDGDAWMPLPEPYKESDTK